jgi:alanyl-tRNA synthetase
VLPGEVAFKLHDTYGFPLDLTNDVCRERGVTVDEAGFTPPWTAEGPGPRGRQVQDGPALEYTGAANTFTGYEQLAETAKIVALYVDGQRAAAEGRPKRRGGAGHPVLRRKRRPGGRRGRDHRGGRFAVGDTLKIKADVFGHHGTLEAGTLKVGDAVQAQVDTRARRHHAQPLGHPPHAQGPARSAGQPRAAKGLAGQCRAHPLRLCAQRPVTAEQIREIEPA